MSIKQIIFQENVKMIDDISTLELDKMVNENLSIIVPFLTIFSKYWSINY